MGIGFRSMHRALKNLHKHTSRACGDCGTSEVVTSVDTLCSRANICPVSQDSRDRATERRKGSACQPTTPSPRLKAQTAAFVFIFVQRAHRHAMAEERLPMLARIKILQIMGYLSRDAASCSSHCHSDVPGRDARAGISFVSSALSA